jgi:hypothetical protein
VIEVDAVSDGDRARRPTLSPSVGTVHGVTEFDHDRPLCPECGEHGVPIVYGMPTPEMEEAVDRGEYELGGCCIGPDMPTHECPAGHQWT